MPTECAQMLATRYDDLPKKDGGFYASTHINHPMSIWVREHPANTAWCIYHGLMLCKEYEFRYGKIHGAAIAIVRAATHYHSVMQTHYTEYWKKHTPPPLCMPDEYKTDNHVDSYVAYYRAEKLKQYPRWTKRDVPSLFTEYIQRPTSLRILLKSKGH